MDRRKFIGTCTCCAFASMGAVFLNKDNIFANSKNIKSTMKHVEVHLAEHCNLSCKYCNHFSCIAQKEFYDLDKFKQDMKRMSFIFNAQLNELPLLGGEPLLNPEINEYIKISRKYFPETRISIITNATLLDDMDESFWKTLNENNIDITPSIYPIKINWKSIIDKAKKYNVEIYGEYKLKEKLSTDNVDKFRKNFFSKMALKEDGNTGIDRSNCEIKTRCNTMYDGKLYACPVIAYVKHLNKKFNTNFVVTKDDCVDLYKIKDLRKVLEYIEIAQIPFCKYCGKGTIGVKWENSKEHSLSEWT